MFRFAIRLIFTALLLTFLAACAKPQGVYQYAVFDEFAAGQYEGRIPISELKKHGDFGIGTFHGLDGEMIVLNGVINRADGKCAVSRPPLSTLSPFAHLVFFKPDGSAPLALPGDAKELGKWLDSKLPPGMFAAARVTGTFRHLRIRSVSGFAPPYPPLGEALKSMHVEDLENASGTIVCMRGPDQPTGVWVPGWHFHFLSADGRKGGHVLGVEGLDGEAAWMSTPKYSLELPEKK
ncbi:MAG: acetolactate decarboxylase [Thermodesulfobacteriota bacterium]